MQPLAIIALVFAGVSIFIPVFGVFMAFICSIMAVIAFRSQPTLSGITLGLNIINTAFLSPSIIMTDMAVSSGAFIDIGIAPTDVGQVYFLYVGFHVIMLVIAIIWRLIRGKPEVKNVPVAPV